MDPVVHVPPPNPLIVPVPEQTRSVDFESLDQHRYRSDVFEFAEYLRSNQGIHTPPDVDLVGINSQPCLTQIGPILFK